MDYLNLESRNPASSRKEKGDKMLKTVYIATGTSEKFSCSGDLATVQSTKAKVIKDIKRFLGDIEGVVEVEAIRLEHPRRNNPRITWYDFETTDHKGDVKSGYYFHIEELEIYEQN